MNSPTTTDSSTLRGVSEDHGKQAELEISTELQAQQGNGASMLSDVQCTAANEKDLEAQNCAPKRNVFTKIINLLPFSRLAIEDLKCSVASRRQSRKKTRQQTSLRPLTTFIQGYPNLAAYQDSSEQYMLYRRFGYLQSRVLLNKQDNLRRLEEQLDKFDGENEDCCVTTEPNEETQTAIDARNELLGTIDNALAGYANSLVHAQQLMSFNKPSDGEQESVAAYLQNHKPVQKDERSYVTFKEDLVTLRPGREHAWLDRMIEASLQAVQKPLPFVRNVFCSKETKMKNGDSKEFKDVFYYTRKRINYCASSLITFSILVLLIVPIWLLYYIVTGSSDGTLSGRETAICIGTLLISTLLFSAVLSLFTKATRHEILAAAAAYCAVLVVFLGNVRP